MFGLSRVRTESFHHIEKSPTPCDPRDVGPFMVDTSFYFLVSLKTLPLCEGPPAHVFP